MNLFKRFFQTKTVADRREYFANRRLEILNNSISSFDFANPELCSSVYTSISIIANSVAKLPLAIYKQTPRGKVLYKEHKWFNTIRFNPDLNLSTSKWIGHALTEMYLTGNYFALKQDFDSSFHTKRQLKSLGQVKNVISYEGEIYYQFENVPGWIASKDLIHFYLISKNNGMTGLNPIASIRSEIEIQHGAEQTVRNFYKNGNFQVLWLEVNLELGGKQDKKTLNEYAQKLEADFSGYENSGRILQIPPAYSLKSLPLPDLKFLENSKYTISQIAALFQVPRWMIGAQESTGSYGKAEQEMIAFYNTALANVCNIIRAELEQKILTIEERLDGVTIEFDFKALYQTDHETKANYLKSLSMIGAISPNEIRDEFGYPRIENEYMDATYLQRQYIPVSEMENNVIPIAQGQTQPNNLNEQNEK